MNMISVLIIAKNEAGSIGRAIKSVEGLDEVLVLDSGSSDNTPTIAQEAGARLISTDWPGFAEQRRRALSLAKNDWCLFLDADEELDGDLRISLMTFKPGTGVSGYYLNRANYFLGRRLRHGRWAKDRQLRLFIKGKALISDRHVHEGVEINGGTTDWPHGYILHHTAPTLQRYLEKQNSYTSLEAGQKTAEGRIFSTLKFVFSPPNEFFKLYLWQGGYRDGMRGFILATLSSLYKYAVWAKVYQAQKVLGKARKSGQ